MISSALFGTQLDRGRLSMRHSIPRLVFWLAVVSGTTLAQPTPNPVPFLDQLSHPTAVPGDPSFTLTVDGAGFVPNSIVTLDGSRRPTRFVSSKKLAVLIRASDVAYRRSSEVSVINPPP